MNRELITCSQIPGLAPISGLCGITPARAHQMARRLRSAGFTPHRIRAELSTNGSQVELRTAGSTPHFHADLLCDGVILSSPTVPPSPPKGWRFSFTLSRSSLVSLFYGLFSAVYFAYVVSGVMLCPCVATKHRRYDGLQPNFFLSTLSSAR